MTHRPQQSPCSFSAGGIPQVFQSRNSICCFVMFSHVRISCPMEAVCHQSRAIGLKPAIEPM
eukprot:CAMPEP_0177442912 /NCGR_PEP_ID=MMETSP0369-20130122/5192_1 /TAXON_ID=447022 ORGANISM="Scrippsiella hangoei-like, Strain SHHI-4" /NCGR_SAMPLE_ID=MMETSP0369 /ASSEMBLY_ACC=CAM_ASM_000364 /LENGTH=61 /DNA_ID=CAMNT_0018914879 /DNA_START=1176 /DNA_END=1361 /DNA_ORIENTATION=+